MIQEKVLNSIKEDIERRGLYLWRNYSFNEIP